MFRKEAGAKRFRDCAVIWQAKLYAIAKVPPEGKLVVDTGPIP